MAYRDVEIFVVSPAHAPLDGRALPSVPKRVKARIKGRSFPLATVRAGAESYTGDIKACAHNCVAPDVLGSELLDGDEMTLGCSRRHNAKVDLGSGVCVAGPRKAQGQDLLPVAVVDGSVCMCGLGSMGDAESALRDDLLSDDFDMFDDSIALEVFAAL